MSLTTKIDGNVNPNEIKKLLSIFRKLKWKIHSDNEQIDDYEDVFNNFCEFLSCLSQEEKDLVLNITEDFLHCPFISYQTLLKTALRKIPLDVIQNSQNVFLIPLINPKDIGVTKSSTSMLYSCLNYAIPRVENFANKQPKSYDDPDLLNLKHKNRKNSLIILIDDFIGTGDTAEKAINYYNSDIRVKTDVPIVVALVAQKQGVAKIEDLGLQIFSTYIRSRCLSDSENIENKFRAVKIIRRIENRMGVAKDKRLGYKKSQALVSMIRTPNNTLPIYWWSRKPNGEKWDGIFRR